METVCYATLSGESNHLVHHIAGACHDEAHVVVVFENLGGSFDEVLGAFLHGDATQEGDHLVFGLWHLHVEELLAEGHHGVVYSSDLRGVDAVALDDGAAGEVADGDDMVSVNHAVALDVIYRGVDVATRPVIVSGMHVNDEGLAGDLLGMYAGGVSEPVVRVNDIAVNGAGDDAGGDGVVVDFLEEVIGVTTGELDAPEVVGAHIVEVGVDVVAEAVV